MLSLQDWRFQKHPLVVGLPYIRFFAAYPIMNPDGHVLGAVSIFDSEPKYGFALTRRSVLERLARKAYEEFEALSHDERCSEKDQHIRIEEMPSDKSESRRSSGCASAKVSLNNLCILLVLGSKTLMQ